MSPRTPLLQPDSYFSERTVTAAEAAVVAAVGVGGFLVIVYAIGAVFAAGIDGTVEVDNPERPPEAFCEDGGAFETGPGGCDEPRTVERNIDEFLWEAVGSVAGQLLVGLVVVWLGVGLALHAGSGLAGGEGAVGRSLAVAAWGLLPGLFSGAAAVVVLAVTFDPVTVAPGDDPAVLREQVVTQVDAVRTFGRVSGLLTTVWSALVWRFGLRHQRAVSGTEATLVAGVVAVCLLLLGAA